MALAVLCRNLTNDYPRLNLKVKAYVVDHRARPGSEAEAAGVAKTLSDIGENELNIKLHI